MGIGREAFYLLAQLNSLECFENKSVLQLGKQSGITSKRQTLSIGKVFDIEFNYTPESKYYFYRNNNYLLK